jgi:xylulokinase
MFLPYLSGERTPHNDASIRGGFAGLGHESDRVALTRAVHRRRLLCLPRQP